MVIDPSSGYNRNGISTANNSGAKVKATAPEAANTSAPEQNVKSQSDNVSLSVKAQTLSRVEAAVADTPEVNEARVAQLKQAVEQGTYRVNAQSVAEKMLAQDTEL